MSEEKKEHGREAELIKHVFATDQGRELLALWSEMFKRSSHQIGNTPQDTGFNEGLRMFYTQIQIVFDEETKK